ncbi:MAG: hypothetical protein CSA40_01415 [Flavobacteriales bacterium]|nr:MAG: hypothetical protein CSA40_01415 [Flavobacteriales bacterium]
MNPRNPIKQQQWHNIVSRLSRQFADGDELTLDAIIYLIGVRELGQGQQTFSKDDKVGLMHIAVCRLLEPYGHYSFDHFDSDGWPHYKLEKPLPQLKPGEQTVLMKEAIITYFEQYAPEFLLDV